MSNEVMVWHFAAPTLRDGSPLPVAGDRMPYRKPVPCSSGWHGSVRILDALTYAPGLMLARRRLTWTVIPHGNPIDKHCASGCVYSTSYADASAVVVAFAGFCAADADARYAARYVADARYAADDAADAARYAARYVAADAAAAAARYADAARYAADAAAAAAAARYAADAARYAADARYVDAEREKQNEWLDSECRKLFEVIP